MNGKKKTSRASLALVWLPSVAYMALIWTLSSIPSAVPLGYVPFEDKGAHLIEYAVLSFLYVFSITRTWPQCEKWAVFLLASLFAALWGAIDETHQYFVPNRFADVMDAVADALGALIGSAASLLYLSFRRRGPRRSQDDTRSEDE